MAQKEVQNAWNSYSNYMDYGREVKDLLKAYNHIEAAVADEEAKNSSKTWYYRGLIYTQLAAYSDSLDIAKDAMDVAYDAFIKTIDLEKNEKRKAKTEDAYKELCLMYSSLYNNGSVAFQNKDYETAYNLFDKANEVMKLNACNPSKEAVVDTAAIFAMGLSAYSAEKMDKAINAFDQLVEMNYNEPAVYITLSNIYRETENVAKADEVLAKGRSLFPDNKEIIIAEVNAHLAGGDAKDAILLMQDAIRLDPENATLHFALGTAYDAQKDFVSAEKAYLKALEFDPNYFNAYYNLGTISYNEAAQLTTEMNEKDEAGKLSDQEYTTTKAKIDRLFEKALPYFEKAHQIDPADRSSMIALKEIYARQNKFDKVNEIKAQMK